MGKVPAVFATAVSASVFPRNSPVFTKTLGCEAKLSRAASKTAKSKKSNKLPSTEILRSRKDCIVVYWEFLRGKNSQCFDKEAETLLMMLTNNWQNALYGQMCNAVEVTALQRGVGRWPAP